MNGPISAISRISSRLSAISCRTNFLSALASAEYSPCLKLAFLDRSSPSGVRGPVLLPPCMRQLPFCIAAARQSDPERVLAPHLGAFMGLPWILPFRSRVGVTVLVAWGSFRIFFFCSPVIDRSDDCLSAFVDVYVLDDHLLLAAVPIAFQGLHLGRVRPH